ncbi:MAG: glutathione S-transferase N-terminal domain-containing protein [Patescibacteria group bacterium]|nr:glutathione S-transferase N-terminal domain-containing protein [Patescibacteria group bacterium]
MAKVILYTTPTCVYCKAAKEFFEENNVEYEEKDVSKDEADLQEMVKKSGGMAVPVIDIDGEIVVGFNKDQVADLLGVGK